MVGLSWTVIDMNPKRGGSVSHTVPLSESGWTMHLYWLVGLLAIAARGTLSEVGTWLKECFQGSLDILTTDTAAISQLERLSSEKLSLDLFITLYVKVMLSMIYTFLLIR